MSQGNRRLRRFWVYLRPFRVSFALLAVTIVAALLIQLPTPWIEKIIIDEALPQGDLPRLFRLVALVAGLYVTMRLVVFARAWLGVRVKQRVLTAVRMHMYEHLQRLSLRFYARHPAGGLLSRVTSDVSYVQNLLSQELFEVIGSAIKVVIVLVLLLVLSPRLTLYCVAIVPVLALVFFLFKRRVYRENRAQQESQAELSARIQQNFAGMKLIQAESIEDDMRRSTLEASRGLERVAVRREMVGVTGNLLTTVLSYVPLIVILWGVGGAMVVRGTLTLGELLAYTQYVLGLVMPVTRFFRFNMDLQAGYAALDRMYEILDTEPDIQDAPDARPAPADGAEIVFDRVSLDFREPPQTGSTASGDAAAGHASEGNDGPQTRDAEEGRPEAAQVGDAETGGSDAASPRAAAVALDDVSFTLQPGERVALVGPSGAGKTSVAHLLLRFYDPTGGEVRLGGAPLSVYTLESLRERVAYVAQEPFLFGTSIRENITLGRDVPPARLQEAVRQAAVDEFLDGLDAGLDTPLEPGGTNLSGGQRQRIALARALCREAPIYVLDEATSALDPGIEKRLIESLRPFFEGRTAVIIAHRFAWLALADRILVFAGGRLVEQGTREDLLARQGLFHALSLTSA